MKFVNYLSSHSYDPSKVALDLGVSAEAIRNYIKGRVPKKHIIEAIYEWSNGAVTPNDFYDLPALSLSVAPSATINPYVKSQKEHSVNKNNHQEKDFHQCVN